MGKPTGFLEYPREQVAGRPVNERVRDYRRITLPLSEEVLHRQSARCMDCGIPFCHGIGCPLFNRIPEFNDFVYRGRWLQACDNLHSTNNFPEITGMVCPALCEAACTLNIDTEPVLIRQIELEIAECGFEAGFIKPRPAKNKTGKRVAIVGSGPAGLAVAQQLSRFGHDVVVFEKDRSVGGLLRYGIPDFKLEKWVIERRLEQMRAEGVDFQTNVNVGEDVSLKYLRGRFDAICLAMGAGQPRNLPVPGRGLDNICFAMDYLTQQNRINAGENFDNESRIDAAGKVVVVIGGGDTGSDCVGTARRQGAREIHQLEILPQPPEKTNSQTPWPMWPDILRTSSSHEEGCTRRWSVLTKSFTGVGVRVSKINCCRVEWTMTDGGWEMKEIPGSEFSTKADLVLLAMGFTHVTHSGLVEKLRLNLNKAGNIVVDADAQSSEPGIFAAGDSVSGASLVVRAIASGRAVADSISRWLLQR